MTPTQKPNLEELFEKTRFNIHGEDADDNCDCHICLELIKLHQDLLAFIDENKVMMIRTIKNDITADKVVYEGEEAVPVSVFGTKKEDG